MLWKIYKKDVRLSKYAEISYKKNSLNSGFVKTPIYLPKNYMSNFFPFHVILSSNSMKIFVYCKF